MSDDGGTPPSLTIQAFAKPAARSALAGDLPGRLAGTPLPRRAGSAHTDSDAHQIFEVAAHVGASCRTAFGQIGHDGEVTHARLSRT